MYSDSISPGANKKREGGTIDVKCVGYRQVFYFKEKRIIGEY